MNALKTYSQVAIKMVSKIKHLSTSPTSQSEKIKKVSLKKMSKTEASTLGPRGCIKSRCGIFTL